MPQGDQADSSRQPGAPSGGWANDFPRIALVVVIIAAFGILLVLLWYSIHVLLLAFGGILFAIFLRTLADGLAYLTRLGPTLCLAMVLVGLIVLVLGAGTLFAPYVATQIDELREAIPEAIRAVREQLEQYAWGDFLVNQFPTTADLANAPAELWLGAFGALGWALSMITGVIVIFFLGIYLAADPPLYVQGLVHLTPLDYRPQMRELFQRLGNTLRWWLIGQAIAMLFIGIIATVGLTLMGVPLAPVLGILSGLLTFIPTFGPILGSILPILLAFTVSPFLAVYVLAFYLLIENFEGYILSPMIQQRVVQLPKALAITFQIVMLILIGPLGLMLGHPIAAAAKVAVQQLYVRDTLGDRTTEIPGG